MSQVFKRVSDGQFRYRPAGVDTRVNLIECAEATVTTTGNIDNLDFSNATVLRMNNATDSTISGLVAGVAGQILVIRSLGAGNVFLAHQNTNSSVANRLINFVTSGNTPLAAGVGMAILEYDATTARWILVAHQQGAPISVAYASGNFTASGSMTWTVDAGDQKVYSYLLEGCRLIILVTIENATVGGTPSTDLDVAVPGGFTITANTFQPVNITDNNVDLLGSASALASGTVIRVRVSPAGNWTSTTNANGCTFQFVARVN